MTFVIIASFLAILLVIVATLCVWADVGDEGIFQIGLLALMFAGLALTLPGLVDRIAELCYACWTDQRLAFNDGLALAELCLAAYSILRIIRLDPLGIVARKQHEK